MANLSFQPLLPCCCVLEPYFAATKSDTLPVLMQAAHRRLHRRERQRAAVAALSLDTLKDIGGLVVFSALPFVAVQALADSK